ncbi:hypothetical protein [Flavihumibacter solisilvae]|uniref:Uncharacterized protein n=1 Tax=Flavihumibacter solisilvae TaxID=1349421 RepID=A0A0C1L0N8_9BACT|nr:hypothetical protein [Flavihumibacter solisilvae]KIC93562.1 hypothetical protein OI18_17675 [Flavihumibacter solisilvae]
MTLRKDYLCRFSEGKKIIHVSSVDHIPLEARSMFSYFRMHQQLADCSSVYLEIDLGTKGVLAQIDGQMQRRIETDYLFTDENRKHISKHKWDAMFLNGVLEYMEDPLPFLRAIRKQYKDSLQQLLVIVPNAMAAKQLPISSHYYWFSQDTLYNMLHRSGFTPTGCDFTLDETITLNPAMKIYFTINPMLQPYLVVAAQCSQ